MHAPVSRHRDSVRSAAGLIDRQGDQLRAGADPAEPLDVSVEAHATAPVTGETRRLWPLLETMRGESDLNFASSPV